MPAGRQAATTCQPWRFEIINDDEVVVHIRCPGDVYDYRDGEPTLLSGGMLLESMRIAASYWGRSLEWTYEGRNEHQTHRIRVLLPRVKDTAVDPLFSYIPMRSVDRRPYRLRALTAIAEICVSGGARSGVRNRMA